MIFNDDGYYYLGIKDRCSLYVSYFDTYSKKKV